MRTLRRELVADKNPIPLSHGWSWVRKIRTILDWSGIRGLLLALRILLRMDKYKVSIAGEQILGKSI